MSDSATPWTVAHQAPPSVGFSRQEYWSRLPFSSPGDLPNPGIEPRSPTLQADALTQECSNYSTIALISHASKVMLKILQARLQQYVNCEHPDNQAGFRKGRGIKLPTSVGSLKKQESAREVCTSGLLTMPKPLTVWITTNQRILKEMEIPDHMTCFLRNLNVVQEAS